MNKQKTILPRQNTESKKLKKMCQKSKNNGQQDTKKQSLKFLQSTALFPGLGCSPANDAILRGVRTLWVGPS